MSAATPPATSWSSSGWSARPTEVGGCVAGRGVDGLSVGLGCLRALAAVASPLAVEQFRLP
eukprot:5770723-Alexandrium_andersonii.AAC.1